MKNECIIYTEDYYKPNKTILDLDDHVIELWYNKLSLEFVKLLRKIDRIEFETNENVTYIIKDDIGPLKEYWFLDYSIENKFTIRNTIYKNWSSGANIILLEKIVLDLFKHLILHEHTN